MKTIIQEIIDKYYQSSIYRCEFTEWLKENKDILIEKEKEHIRSAYNKGRFNAIDGLEISSAEYFNQTYNQNK